MLIGSSPRSSLPFQLYVPRSPILITDDTQNHLVPSPYPQRVLSVPGKGFYGAQIAQIFGSKFISSCPGEMAFPSMSLESTGQHIDITQFYKDSISKNNWLELADALWFGFLFEMVAATKGKLCSVSDFSDSLATASFSIDWTQTLPSLALRDQNRLRGFLSHLHRLCDLLCFNAAFMFKGIPISASDDVSEYKFTFPSFSRFYGAFVNGGSAITHLVPRVQTLENNEHLRRLHRFGLANVSFPISQPLAPYEHTPPQKIFRFIIPLHDIYHALKANSFHSKADWLVHFSDALYRVFIQLPPESLFREPIEKTLKNLTDLDCPRMLNADFIDDLLVDIPRLKKKRDSHFNELEKFLMKKWPSSLLVILAPTMPQELRGQLKQWFPK